MTTNPNNTNPANLLSAFAEAIFEATTANAAMDSYLAARSTFYMLEDAGQATPAVRTAWRAVITEMSDWNVNHPVKIEGLVSFADGSRFGGAK